MPARPILLAWLARGIGALAVVLGVGHEIPVVTRLLHGSRRYDLDAVELLWIGGLLVFSGALNLGASGGLRRGERWAWGVSGAATGVCVLFTASLAPIFGNPLNLLLLVTHSAYLAWWASQRPPGARDRSP